VSGGKARNLRVAGGAGEFGKGYPANQGKKKDLADIAKLLYTRNQRGGKTRRLGHQREEANFHTSKET